MPNVKRRRETKYKNCDLAGTISAVSQYGIILKLKDGGETGWLNYAFNYSGDKISRNAVNKFVLLNIDNDGRINKFEFIDNSPFDPDKEDYIPDVETEENEIPPLEELIAKPQDDANNPNNSNGNYGNNNDDHECKCKAYVVLELLKMHIQGGTPLETLIETYNKLKNAIE